MRGSRSSTWLLVVVVGAAAACGPLRSADRDRESVLVDLADAPPVEVVAVDNLFQPDVTTVPVGSEVLWRNDGAIEHDIAPADGADGFGVALADFAPGATYSYTFDAPGTYRYYCTIHGTRDRGMIGVVEVTT